MANPEHKEILDSIDKLSVCLYRVGISLFALSLFILAVLLSGLSQVLLDYKGLILLCISISATLSAVNIHVYSKMVRTVISWSAWIGVLLMLSDSEQSRVWLSLGFIFITFSGIALKESFCFKVAGLKLVPILFAMSILAMALQFSMIASISMAMSAVIIGYLSLAKWRMPLHFDIGKKSNYEI